MKAARLVVTTALMLSMMVTIGPRPAVAHGDCGPGAPNQSNGSYIAGWLELTGGGNWVMKGQTKFYCVDSEQHKTITVNIRLYRCRITTGACEWKIWDTKSNTCSNAIQCQKTITSPNCEGGYKWQAWGRWYAQGNNGHVHKNPAYPGYDRQFPVPLEGAFSC